MLRKLRLNDLFLKTKQKKIIQQPTNKHDPQSDKQGFRQLSTGGLKEFLIEHTHTHRKFLRRHGLQEVLNGAYLNTCVG